MINIPIHEIRVWQVQRSKSLWKCCRLRKNPTMHIYAVSYRNAKFEPWAEPLQQNSISREKISHCWLCWTLTWIPPRQSNRSPRESEWPSELLQILKVCLQILKVWRIQYRSKFGAYNIEAICSSFSLTNVLDLLLVAQEHVQIIVQESRIKTNRKRTNGRPVMMTQYTGNRAWMSLDNLPSALTPLSLGPLGFRMLCFRSIRHFSGRVFYGWCLNWFSVEKFQDNTFGLVAAISLASFFTKRTISCVFHSFPWITQKHRKQWYRPEVFLAPLPRPGNNDVIVTICNNEILKFEIAWQNALGLCWGSKFESRLE